jgi:glycosyltransferase involved in cell wall biosynthesis
VIPVRNGKRYLAEAIGSVLAQSQPPDEVVVVDDGSSDGTAAVAGSFGSPVRCVVQPPLGVAAATNRGVRETGGDVLAFLDADDLWAPDKLVLQLGALEERPELDAVLGQVEKFCDNGIVGDRVPGYLRGAMLIRREAFDRVGPFADWRLGEFVEWYARAVDAGIEVSMLPELVLHRRVHDANTGVLLRDERAEYARVMEAVLDRRRAGRP